jgi:hypothetical protein
MAFGKPGFRKDSGRLAIAVARTMKIRIVGAGPAGLYFAR